MLSWLHLFKEKKTLPHTCSAHSLIKCITYYSERFEASSHFISKWNVIVLVSVVLGPVARRSISTNQGLDFNLGFFFFLSNTFSCIIFSILFRVSNHQIANKKNSTEFAVEAFISKFKFRTNPGYLNPALNNVALQSKTKTNYPCVFPPQHQSTSVGLEEALHNITSYLYLNSFTLNTAVM